MLKKSTRGGDSHNYEIDFWRFVFSLIVLLHHAGNIFDYKIFPAPGGALAVEFFLLLTGFLTMGSIEKIFLCNKSFDKKKAGYFAYKLTLKKIKSIFPYVIVSVLIVYFTYAIIGGLTIFETFSLFINSIYEILLLPLTGIRSTFYVVQLWYLDCLIIVIPILYYLIIKYNDFIKNIFIYIFPLLVYGYFIVNYSNLVKWDIWVGYTYVGVFRVAAGICLGCVCFNLYEALISIKLTKLGRRVITIFQIICFSIPILRMVLCVSDVLNVLDVMLMMLGIIITFSRQSHLSNLLNRCFFGFLGRLSLPLYTSHWVFREVFKKYVINMISSPSVILILFILASMALALVLLIFIERLNHMDLFHKVRRKLVID